jgi:hypothetical protein
MYVETKNNMKNRITRSHFLLNKADKHLNITSNIQSEAMKIFCKYHTYHVIFSREWLETHHAHIITVAPLPQTTQKCRSDAPST